MKALSRFALLACVLFMMRQGAFAQTQNCPAGTMRELDSGRCLPVQEIPVPNPQPAYEQPPSLLELRQGQNPKLPTPEPTASVPPPGGIGGGITYLNDQLQAIDGGILYTTMFVQPKGLNPSTGGLDWLFTTSTNRTEKGVEVVGVYNGANAGALGVYDWSCSPSDPCIDANGTQTSPSWVWTSGFNNFACNITTIADQVGHAVRLMQYLNQTTPSLGPAPVWSNAVYLRNFCERRWDLVWSHQYAGPQMDCSLTGACGWWGPILETFSSGDGEPFPQINELGFEHTTLVHDGITSHLPPSEAYFYTLWSPWNLFFLDPNQGYGAGNYFQQSRGSNDGG
ncbi:MAG: hypothetical protein JO121_09605 [Deltaproteobacteria bacterium]|nr:hypothetical protein [Deltaproteobacteria bacterium]